ncbi:MAG: hypothetical protein AVDCRST_MAG22-2168, partial [uncultured Rubrobacteraceae bacterium]
EAFLSGTPLARRRHPGEVGFRPGRGLRRHRVAWHGGLERAAGRPQGSPRAGRRVLERVPDLRPLYRGLRHGETPRGRRPHEGPPLRHSRARRDGRRHPGGLRTRLEETPPLHRAPYGRGGPAGPPRRAGGARRARRAGGHARPPRTPQPLRGPHAKPRGGRGRALQGRRPPLRQGHGRPLPHEHRGGRPRRVHPRRGRISGPRPPRRQQPPPARDGPHGLRRRLRRAPGDRLRGLYGDGVRHPGRRRGGAPRERQAPALADGL